MKVMDQRGDQNRHQEVGHDNPSAELLPLLTGRSTTSVPASGSSSVVVGELVAIKDSGHTPLVTFDGQNGSAALPARSVVDLHGAHIGKAVVLLFEQGDPARPIIVGVLREGQPSTPSGRIEVETDGERLVLDGKRQVVLRCGKAAITLTHEGKILIEGSYVLSRSSGVNRIKGGSVQIN